MTDKRQHYEDIVVGLAQRFGPYVVDREEIIAFAGKYDPQDFHLDDAAAAAGPFGKVAASGWHTAAIAMRLLVDGTAGQQAGLGGAGVEELRWSQPVYPGDALTLELVVTEKRRSRSRPELGILRLAQRMLNQHGEEVMRMTSIGMIRVRDPGTPISG